MLHVILSGASTLDMIFMTGGGLTSFFHDLTVKGLTVLTHVGGLVRVDAGEKLGSVVGGSSSRFIIEKDTSIGTPARTKNNIDGKTTLHDKRKFSGQGIKPITDSERTTQKRRRNI
ncbi:hypothetical protein K503DRAFT_495141 [Rhizopogon vinicolor AM-OR11-026]|uniref:Uncharacterized protein n=1 Tax=Rhizopogon vinicolor AM-OR11-026 TaxID=1314800 RepID=A0A1B7MMA9_9AGAM|nr:hypothetical protein K503DRAFT_495141 [Rhizopogon vinicolor AM-OR11-026]